MVHLHLLPLSSDVRSVYQNHGHFHEGDCGLDLFVVKEQTVGAGETATIPLGIKAAVYANRSDKANNNNKTTAEEVASHSTTTPSLNEQNNNNTTVVDKTTASVGWLLFPRSSISKTPLRLCNSVGVIDGGYRGEIMVVVDNIKQTPYTVKVGDRIVQAVAFDGKEMSFEVVERLDEKTARGAGGFGSTTTTTMQDNNNNNKTMKNGNVEKENVGKIGEAEVAESKKQKIDV
eukprot:GHVS01078500.1.p1 GENE.GHVS01078500.1~~GHVS01078500.1.p1  ORF type:complete len:232 (-),score=84.53 GHVS01078500.1:262-957(-)